MVKESYKVIRISVNNHNRLIEIQDQLKMRKKKNLSIDNILGIVLDFFDNT